MNEEKFDGKAALYSSARPGYPTALFEALREKEILTSDTTAADIGSGTGIFTLSLLPYVKKIFAVEPNEDMRKTAEKVFAGKDNVVSVCGGAENTGLPDGSVSLVTAAQAFHWFDRAAFQKECRRILKAHGKVVLLWNERDENCPLVSENLALNERFFGKRCGAEGMSRDFSDFFKGEYTHLSFENPLFYTEETFLRRCLSSSYAPKKGEAEYVPYAAALKELFRRHEKDGTAVYSYTTNVYFGDV